MALIRASMARSRCGNGWARVLRELRTRRRDILELNYLHSILEQFSRPWRSRHIGTVTPFSLYDDKAGYAGFSPSSRYLNTIYVDFSLRIRPILDQCMAMLPTLIIKVDHSYKVCSVPTLDVFCASSYTFCAAGEVYGQT